MGTTIFSEMSALAREYQAINLGQGFPDFDGPREIRRIAMECIARGQNQYALMQGEAILRRAVARHSARFYQHEPDPDAEITITCGATEALMCAALAFINPGDEVIVFEPCYDSYVPAIRMAGGIPVPVTLHAPAFTFDPLELRAAFTKKTKAVIVNTPHNPTGTVFTNAELGFIADLCCESDTLAIVDEVYEHLLFDQAMHMQLRSFPGMEDRTITISSAGKTFSFTGWKTGWAIAAPHLQKALRSVHQYMVFSTPSPFQYAAAAALDLPDDYYVNLQQRYQRKRNYLADILRQANMPVYMPSGAYFIMADSTAYPFISTDDFARWLIRAIGVACIPPASFYLRPERAGKYVRFCFCKRTETLEEAATRLHKLHAGHIRPA